MFRKTKYFYVVYLVGGDTVPGATIFNCHSTSWNPLAQPYLMLGSASKFISNNNAGGKSVLITNAIEINDAQRMDFNKAHEKACQSCNHFNDKSSACPEDCIIYKKWRS